MVKQEKEKTINGVLWSLIERFSVQGVQFLLSIIIARLVLPTDYGIIAIVIIFISIAQAIIDGGFTNALIHKQNRTEIDCSTVFFFNIFVSILLYISLYCLSPFIAMFYSEPILSSVIRLVGLVLIIDSFSIVQKSKLIINLDFKLQTLISLFAVFISGTIGIFYAFNGKGVWALVTQTVLNSFIVSVLLWIFVKWRPLFCFSYSSFKVLFKHGYPLLITAIVNNLFQNLYSLVIGKYYTITSVGYYNRSLSFAQYPSNNISNTMNRAIFPVLCNVQENPDELLILYKKVLRVTAIFLFPLMSILCSLSHPFIELVLGYKWIECADVLSILCLACFFIPVINLVTQVLYATCSRYSLKAEVIKKIYLVLVLSLTMPVGLKAICWGSVICSIVDVWIMSIFLAKVIRITFWNQIKILMPILAVCLIIFVVNFVVLVLIRSSIMQIVVGVSSSFIIFFTAMTYLKLDEYKFLKQYVLFKLNRK